MIKAVLFDMDGVLADTEPLHFLALQRLMKEFKVELPDSSFEQNVGVSEAAIWESAKIKYNIECDFDSFENKRRAFLYDIIEESLFPAKGLYKFMDDLKANGIRRGLVTSSGREVVDKILRKLELEREFETIVSADDVKEKKPDSEPYLNTIAKLGLSNDECVAIEDSAHGIDSAKSAGIFCIGLNIYDKIEIVRNADLVVTSMEDLDLQKISEHLSNEK